MALQSRLIMDLNEMLRVINNMSNCEMFSNDDDSDSDMVSPTRLVSSCEHSEVT